MSLFYVKEPNGIWRKRTASLDHYDPEFLQRAVALWADSRIGDRYFCNSGSRSYAHQVVLYVIYKAGGNLAARPGTSNHEWGSKTHPFALAMDINPLNGSYGELHKVAYEYGFHFPIASEKWHMEMRPGRKSLSVVSPTEVFTEEKDMSAYASEYRWANDGAVVQVMPDGSVKCYGAKSYGSMLSLRDDAKKGFVTAAAIRPVDVNNSQAGYIVGSASGPEYRFEPGVEVFFKK